MAIKFTWKILLQAPPARLWRYIADTNRINQYAGLPEFTFRYIQEQDGGSSEIGEARYWGWRLSWDEHPFEWIEGERFEVLRSYHSGPLKEFRTIVVLRPEDGRTLVEQTIVCRPRWFFVTPALYWEIGVVSRRRFEAAYRKIEKFLQGDGTTPLSTTGKRYRPAVLRPYETVCRIVPATNTFPGSSTQSKRFPTTNWTGCACSYLPTGGRRRGVKC